MRIYLKFESGQKSNNQLYSVIRSFDNSIIVLTSSEFEVISYRRNDGKQSPFCQRGSLSFGRAFGF